MSKPLNREISNSNNEEDDIDDLQLSTLTELWGIRFQQDTKQRKWLGIWTAFVVTAWLIGVFIILCNNENHFCLSNSVLSVLLSTTTLNILGLSYIVLKGLFGDKK